MLSDLLFRLRAIFRRRDVETELADELQFHLEREAEKRMALGMSRAEALRQANLALGGAAQIREECRQARGVSAVESTIQDIRYAIRGMRRTPAFTITALVTIAFGAAAISTVFTLANTLFFRELPVERADRLVVVQATREHGRWPGWVSYADYVRFRGGTKTLQDLAAHFSNAPFFVTSADQSREVNGAVVSSNFFPLLGVKPALGRFFSPAEDLVPGRDRVAVVGYEFWRNWLDSSPNAIGAALKINGTAFTVIGVAPESFRGMTVQPGEIYIPTMMAATGYRWCEDAFACNVFNMAGRLRDGRTIEEARAEMATLIPPSWASAKDNENSGITVVPATGVWHPDIVRGSEIHFIEILVCVAGVLLLVCSVNLTGLTIARNSARTREFAIRASLGAGRLRLIRQLLTESLLLASAGGVLGVLLSLALTSALNAIFYSVDVLGRPLYYNFNPEPRVIVGVLAVSVLAGLLAGIVPALKSFRSGSADNLKRQSSAVSASPKLGRWLAGAQVALGVALAAVAGLLIASARGLITGTGFDPSHVALMRLNPRLVNYSAAQAQRFVRSAIERLEALPGVESVTVTGAGSLLIGKSARVSVPDRQELHCGYIEAGPRYFETLRIPILRGREFDRRETAQSPPVAIVSESLAKYGAGVGATLLVNGRPYEVAGIARDITRQRRGQPVEPYVYTAYWQNPAQIEAHVAVRVKGDPAATLPVLTRELNRIDLGVPIDGTLPLTQELASSTAPLPITAAFVSYAAVLSVLLSSIGLYGALAFAVSRRTKEIGIRLAVGAESRTVLGMVFREGAAVIVAGAVIGVPLAIAATRFIRHLLYGAPSGDVPVYAAAVAIMMCAGLLASWTPARRAASVEPLVALREE